MYGHMPMGSGETSSANPDGPLRLRVDFQQARRQIERLEEYPPSVRSRALATYVGLFDFAADDGTVAGGAGEIAANLQITRVSWLQYRKVLEQAGLLHVGRRHGGQRRDTSLLAPNR